MILNTIIFNELWGHMIHVVYKSEKIRNLKVDFESIEDTYSIEILQNHTWKLIV